VREKRDTLLKDSDVTQLMDFPLTDAMRAEWAAYRQALRNLPDQSDDPQFLVWPVAPGASK
jgi:hypothetical protein